MIELFTQISEPVIAQNLGYFLDWIEIEYTAYNVATMGVDQRTGKYYNGIILELFHGFSTIYPLHYLNRRVNRIVIPPWVSVNGFRVYFPQGTKVSIRIEERP
jgi:hypothetical protein